MSDAPNIPASVEAEVALLAALLADPGLLAEVVEVIPDGSKFYDPANSALFDAIRRTVDECPMADGAAIDLALLTGRTPADVLDALGGGRGLADLRRAGRTDTAMQHARTVAGHACRRALIDAGAAIDERARNADTDAEALEFAAERVLAIADTGADDTLEDGLSLVHRLTDALHDDGPAPSLPTGFADLDSMTTGFHPGEMVVIGARPSMGKSALLLNMTEAIARHLEASDDDDGRVWFASLEMGRDEIGHRKIAAEAGVDIRALRRRNLMPDELRLCTEANGRMGHWRRALFEYRPGLTLAGLRSRARRMVRTRGVRAIVVDYLQLLSDPVTAKQGRYNEVSAVSRGLKVIAGELSVPVIVAAQLNRAPETRKSKLPKMSDLRDSGQLEQDADLVLFLHREEQYHKATPSWADKNPDKVGEAKVIVAKQRNGPTGVVTLQWDGERMRFASEIPEQRCFAMIGGA